MTPVRAAALVCAGATIAFSPAARAQEPVSGTQFTVGGVAAEQIVQSHVDSSNDRFTGTVFGLEGGLVNNRFALRIGYAQGHVAPKPGSSLAGRDVVEGEALVGYQAAPWLAFWAGPSARAYTVGDTNQRWLIWSARASARGTLLPGKMQTFLELWTAFSGSVGSPSLKAGGSGANAGLEMRLAQTSSFWGRLGYRIESTHAEGLRETVESLGLSLFYGLPQ
jgi:hypothetical protein